MRQIVYFSTAAGRQDETTIAAIAAASRERKLRDKLSGLLVAGGQRYLEVIEGEANRVDALIEAIRRDQCHVGVSVLVARKVMMRSFAGWSATYFDPPLRHDYATLGDLIDQMRTLVRERKLRAQLDCFERRFAIPPVAPAASPWTLATSYQPDLSLDRGH